MLTEKVLACLSTSKQTKLPSSNFAPTQTFLILLSCDISVCEESPAQLFAAPCYFLCVQPARNTPCPTDAQFNLFSARVMYLQHCPTPPHLSLCQGNFCLLRLQQSVTSTSQSNSNTVCSDIYKLTPIQLLDLILSWLPDMTHNVLLTPFY